MTADATAIRKLARELYDERVVSQWSESEQDAYADAVIRRVVAAIAASGELAGLAQVIRMVTPNMAYADRLIAEATAIIQDARHAQFAGNTGWTWDEDDRQWVTWRGGAKIVARFPRDQMPPVRADWLGIELAGESWHGAVARGRMENPGEKALPWSRPVLAEIPVTPGTEDWYLGLRGRVYLGMLCSPCGRTDARVCLQPARPGSGAPQCIPVDPDHVRLIVLDGKLADYA